MSQLPSSYPLMSHPILIWTLILMWDSWIESDVACLPAPQIEGSSGPVIAPSTNELQCNETMTLKPKQQLRTLPFLHHHEMAQITSCETNRALCGRPAGSFTKWPEKETFVFLRSHLWFPNRASKGIARSGPRLRWNSQMLLIKVSLSKWVNYKFHCDST